MRQAKRIALAAMVVAALAGCSARTRFLSAYERVVVGKTARAEVDPLFGQGPVRPGPIETFVAPDGDPYVRLVYSQDAASGIVRAKHFLAYSDSVGTTYRTLKLARLGEVQAQNADQIRSAIKAQDVDPLIDLLAPGAGTLTAVLNETPLMAQKYGKVVSIRDEFRPEPPPPPPGQRHLPEVFLYTRRGTIPDFAEAAGGFGRWTLITTKGPLHSAFFVPGQIYPGARSHQQKYVDAHGFLTFVYRYTSYTETVETVVAGKETSPGIFSVRYETTAQFLRKP